MALTITPQISGQVADGTLSYCFLMEPLKVHITDSDANTSIIYADITRIATDTGVEELVKADYIMRDVSSLGGVVIDLTKVMKQLHDFDTLKFGSISNIVAGWDSVVSKYIYKFEFRSDQAPTVKTTILKLPIIGGRSFENFAPVVNFLTPIRELSLSELQDGKLGGYQIVNFVLKQISAVLDSDYSPSSSISSITEVNNNCPNGGVIHWKSKLGGWMSWGMDLKTVSKSHSYMGNLDVGMFESTIWSGGGNSFAQVNYTGSTSGETVSLKSLSRSVSELIGLSEINGTPAVYFQRTSSSKLELMRLASASAPIKTYINGGDFSVSLKNISSTEYKVK